MTSLIGPRSDFPSLRDQYHVEVNELRDLRGDQSLLLFHQHIELRRVAHETCQEVSTLHACIILLALVDPSLMMLASWHDLLHLL